MATHRARSDEREHVVVVSEPEPRRREVIRAQLGVAATRDRADVTQPRYRIRFAHDCEEAVRLVGPEVTALVLNLTVGRTNGVKAIETLRPHRPDLAIL